MNAAVLARSEIDRLWFTGEAVPGARFRLNDAVRINNGPHMGECAAVIALLALRPSPRYLVELGSSGHDIKCDEFFLTHAA